MELPTLQEAERVILDVFKDRNARPGEPVKLHVALNDHMAGRYSADDFNAAIQSMLVKEWIIAVRGGLSYALTPLGYAQV